MSKRQLSVAWALGRRMTSSDFAVRLVLHGRFPRSSGALGESDFPNNFDLKAENQDSGFPVMGWNGFFRLSSMSAIYSSHGVLYEVSIPE